MRYLNNPHLNSENIIALFKTSVLDGVPPQNKHTPSLLQQFKNKLKANFFERLDKHATDHDVLAALQSEERFNSGYPRLKHVLKTIFSLENPIAIPSSMLCDWDAKQTPSQFELLDTRFSYFKKTPKSQHQARLTLFKKLAVACRTMIVLFEENNTSDDIMAYDYAYKLMALFVDPTQEINPTKLFDEISQKTHKLLTQSDTKKAKPFHDVLLVKLALPDARKLADISGWRALIEKEGDTACYYLGMAEKLEQKIAEQKQEPPRAPKNKHEAKTMAMLCNYIRAAEDLEFSNLCQTHKVSELCFNACLDYMKEASGWPKKSNDTIPDIQIKGQGEAEGFYWVKLPVMDKRALILGDITDCCQSIEGHSEQCVKDAVSLSDNALYVLLKQRKKGLLKPLIDNTINDRDFKIIGQSYVWKSKMGNICLDSIECLRDSIPDPALQSMLTDFSTQLLEQNPDVRFVTLGRGGKTPEGLFDEAPIPEQIKQGLAYGDAGEQYCIAKQTCPLEELPDDIQPQDFRDCLNYLRYYLNADDNFVSNLRQLLQQDPSLPDKLTPQSLALFLNLNSAPTLNKLAPVDFDALDNRTAEAKAHQSLWRVDTSEELFRVLQYIPEEKQDDMLCTIDQIKPALFVAFAQKHFNAIRSYLTKITLSPENFNKLLDALPIHQRTEVFEGQKEQLLKRILSAQAFIEVCEHLLPEQRTEVFEAVKNRLPNLIQHAWDLERIFQYLSPHERTEILDEIKDHLHVIIPTPNALRCALPYLSPEQYLPIIIAFKDELLSQNFSPNLKNLVDDIPIEERAYIFEVLKEDIASLLELPETPMNSRMIGHVHANRIRDFMVLRQCFPRQHTEIFNLVKETLPQSIKLTGCIGDNFIYVARLLSPEECVVLYNNFKATLSKPSKLDKLFPHLSKEQQHAILKANILAILTFPAIQDVQLPAIALLAIILLALNASCFTSTNASAFAMGFFSPSNETDTLSDPNCTPEAP